MARLGRATPASVACRPTVRAAARRNSPPAALRALQRGEQPPQSGRSAAADTFAASLALWALAEASPALAAAEAPFGAPPAQSYYVSLGLFVMTAPGERLLSAAARRPAPALSLPLPKAPFIQPLITL